MGVLTDFFLATATDVSRVLAGWQLPPAPLPEPVIVKVVNPFTKETMVAKTRRDRTALPEPPRAPPERSTTVSAQSVSRVDEQAA
jgi:hypothetical protein